MNLSNIPTTTWEQFGLVILFMAFVVVASDRIIKYIDATTQNFQKFLKDQRDLDHQEQMEREAAFSQRNSHLAELLEKVANQLESLTISQEKHNSEMTNAVARMEQKTQPRGPRPR